MNSWRGQPGWVGQLIARMEKLVAKFDKFLDSGGRLRGTPDSTVGVFPSDASIITYTPLVLTDWDGDADPGDVDNALDQLAERTDDLENPAAHVHDSDDVTYVPTTLTDWTGDVDPGDVEQALDQLAGRVDDIEGAAGHVAVTLAADADAILSLTAQEIGLDTQAANVVLAGPTSGGAADPTFRALVDADIPAAIARDSEVTSSVAAHVDDTIDAHDASAISVLDTPDVFGAENVEDVLFEIYDFAQTILAVLGGQISAHNADTIDAHDASAISILDTANDFAATDVEGALAELQADNEAHVAAADPHVGYVKESDASWIDLTDGGASTLHSHAGGSGHTVRENGTDQTARTGLNFIDADAGAGLITDDAGGNETEVNLNLYVLKTNASFVDLTDAGVSILHSHAVAHGTVSTTGMKQTVDLTAGGAILATTTPAVAAQIETATNKVNYKVLDFADASTKYAHWDWVMPDNYDGGTITLTPVWQSTGITGNCRWQGEAVMNGDATDPDVAYGTAVTSDQATEGTASRVNIGAALTVTPSGTPAGGKVMNIRFARLGGHANDTLAATARLRHVIVEYGISALSS